jgi:hypothetical protein
LLTPDREEREPGRDERDDEGGADAPDEVWPEWDDRGERGPPADGNGVAERSLGLTVRQAELLLDLRLEQREARLRDRLGRRPRLHLV